MHVCLTLEKKHESLLGFFFFFVQRTKNRRIDFSLSKLATENSPSIRKIKLIRCKMLNSQDFTPNCVSYTEQCLVIKQILSLIVVLAS